MNNIFLNYPKCSTCKRAEKFLNENNIDHINRHIVEENPTVEELTEWIDRSGLEIKKFFNTSGILYREMNLKERLKDMSKEEKIKLLSQNGMLVKRPLFISKEVILVGFKEDQYRELIK